MIHGRRHDFFAGAGHDCGRQHIVGDAVGHLGNDVGGGRGHEDDVGLLCQRDMGDFELEIPVEGVTLAEAGAIMTTSARFAKATCSTLYLKFLSKVSMRHLLPVRDSKVTGVINCAAFLVIRT